MQDLFWSEAAKNHVLPIHDYSQGVTGRPSLGRGRTHFVYPAGIATINEDAAPRTIGHSFSIDVDVTIPAGGANGVMLAQGGHFGGYSFYLKDGRPVFHYNAVGTDQYRVAANAPVDQGHHVVTADFKIDSDTLRSGGTLTLIIDGKPVASGRIGQTLAQWMSHTEGLDVGSDPITPVSADYTSAASGFTGTIKDRQHQYQVRQWQ